MESSLLVLFLSPTRPKAAESVVQLSSLTELCNGSTFCYFGVYHFANFALAKTGVLQTILSQGLWNTSGCLEPLRSPPSSQSWLSASALARFSEIPKPHQLHLPNKEENGKPGWVPLKEKDCIVLPIRPSGGATQCWVLRGWVETCICQSHMHDATILFL